MPSVTFEKRLITTWEFKPKEDITAYELAQCLIYLDRNAQYQMPMTARIHAFDKSPMGPEGCERHFAKVEDRMVEMPVWTDTRIWDEEPNGRSS